MKYVMKERMNCTASYVLHCSHELVLLTSISNYLSLNFLLKVRVYYYYLIHVSPTTSATQSGSYPVVHEENDIYRLEYHAQVVKF